MDANDLISDLDPDQRAAVTAESHLVAVVAGAGSGKTRVLTRRVAHRIATGDADPSHTLVLTFTREAAGELRRRLRRLGLRDHVTAGTFHSTMLAVLRQRWADTDRSAKTVQPDRRRLLRDAQKEYGLGGGRQTVEMGHEEISWAMARGIDPDRYASLARRDGRRPGGGVDAAQEVYRAYRSIKRKRGVVDFDDVLLDVLADAERSPEFAETLRWRFRHLLVDEAQDLNPVQHRLIDLLRMGRDDVFLVGDPAQAIFGFNGADPTVLVDIESHFPGIEVVRLPVNHRCTPQIVATGAHVLTAGQQSPDIRSARDDGPVVALLEAHDEETEAETIATRIARGDPNLIRSGGIAILARTNALLGAIETALTAKGVSVRRTANARGSPLESALREATGLTSASALRGWAHDVLDDVAALDVARARSDDLERRIARATDPASASLRLVAPHPSQTSEATSALSLVEAERRVAGLLLEFLREQPRADGAEFRSWVATTDPFRDRSVDGVELLTFHASKGREWHTVFVVGVETSLVPHKSATTASEKAEEARALYVATTRATDVLVLSWARRRGGYERRISPLIAELDLSVPDPVAPPGGLVRRAATDPSLDRLREWRANAARKGNIIPTQLMSDRDLHAIAEKRPGTAAELDSVTSIGPITADRLAPEILPLLSAEGRLDR